MIIEKPMINRSKKSNTTQPQKQKKLKTTTLSEQATMGMISTEKNSL